MSTIAIIDHCQIARFGLCIALKKIITNLTVYLFDDETRIFNQLGSIHFDILIIDPASLKGNDIYILKKILIKQQDVKIFLYASQSKSYLLSQYTFVGIYAYLNKKTSLISFFKVVKAVIAGNIHFPAKEDLKKCLVNYPALYLPKRELEIAHLLRAGQSIQKISLSLNIHYTTAYTYKKRIYSKFKSNNIREFVDCYDYYFKNYYRA